jgi:hypothetical protein
MEQVEQVEFFLGRSRLFRNQVDHPEFLQLRRVLQSLLREAKLSSTKATGEVAVPGKVPGEAVSTLRTLFVTLVHVRDIAEGRGERVLTYMMLDVWYQYFPVLAVYALETILLMGYGSWRDIKGLCRYLRKHSIRRRSLVVVEDHPLIETAVELMLRHLKTPGVAKWVPRESSKKLQWLFDLFVEMMMQQKRQSGGCLSERKRQFRRTVADLTAIPVAPVAPVATTLSAATGMKMHSLDKWINRPDEAWKRLFFLQEQEGQGEGQERQGEGQERQGEGQGGDVVVLYFTPEMLHLRDLMQHAVVETVLFAATRAEPVVVVLATQPPVTLDIVLDQRGGYASQAQALLRLLEQQPLTNMDLRSAIQERGGGGVVHIVGSWFWTPVSLSEVAARPRYRPVVDRFDAILCS